jgi:hypothetical protein
MFKLVQGHTLHTSLYAGHPCQITYHGLPLQASTKEDFNGSLTAEEMLVESQLVALGLIEARQAGSGSAGISGAAEGEAPAGECGSQASCLCTMQHEYEARFEAYEASADWWHGRGCCIFVLESRV